MNALAKPRHEPEEHEDPRNALLDVAAEMIRRCVDLGCEAQIRARLESILPPPVKPAATGIPPDALPRAIVVSALREGKARMRAPSSLALFDTALAVMTGNAAEVERRLADPAANLAAHRTTKGD